MDSPRQTFIVHSLNSFRRGARPPSPTSPRVPISPADSPTPTKAHNPQSARRISSVQASTVSTASLVNGRKTTLQPPCSPVTASKTPNTVPSPTPLAGKSVQRVIKPAGAICARIVATQVEKKPIVCSEVKVVSTSIPGKKSPIQYKASRQLPTPPSTPPAEAIFQIRKPSTQKSRPHTAPIRVVAAPKEKTSSSPITRIGTEVPGKDSVRLPGILAPVSATKIVPNVSVTKNIQASI